MVYPLLHRGKWHPLAVVVLATAEGETVPVAAYADAQGVAVFRDDERGVQRGTVVARLLDHLVRPGALAVVYGHAAGRHDLRLVVAEAHRRTWPWQVLGGSGPLVATSVLNPQDGFELRLVDGSRLLPDDASGLIRPPTWDPEDLDERWALHADEVARGVVADVTAWLADATRLVTTLQAHGVQGGGITLGGLATSWIRESAPLASRRLYSRQGFKHFERRPWFAGCEDTARKAHHGGRVQGWHVGPAPVPLYSYDRQAAYAQAMTQTLPTYPCGIEGPEDDPRRVAARLRRVGFSDATATCPEGLALPVLPVRTDARLTFPRGTVRGVWTHLELARAVREGYEVVLHQTHFWRSARWLAPFVRAFWPLRAAATQRGERAVAQALKTFLNVVPGRLLERSDKARLVSGRHYRAQAFEAAMAVGRLPSFDALWGDKVAEATWEERGGCVHGAAGAYVMALGRLGLYDFMDATQRAGGWLFHVNTDGVINDLPPVDLAAQLAPTPDGGPGSWRLLHGPVGGEFLGPHAYRLWSLDGQPLAGTSSPDLFRVSGARIRTLTDWQGYLDPLHGVSQPGYHSLRADVRRGTVTPTSWTMVRRRALDGDVDARDDGPEDPPFVIGEAGEAREAADEADEVADEVVEAWLGADGEGQENE